MTLQRARYLRYPTRAEIVQYRRRPACACPHRRRIAAELKKHRQGARTMPHRVECEVPGCQIDITEDPDGVRFGVCAGHRTRLYVHVGARVQRFCEKCTRFHDLASFPPESHMCYLQAENQRRRGQRMRPQSSGYDQSRPCVWRANSPEALPTAENTAPIRWPAVLSPAAGAVASTIIGDTDTGTRERPKENEVLLSGKRHLHVQDVSLRILFSSASWDHNWT